MAVLGQVRYPSMAVMESATERDVFVGLEEIQEGSYWVNCNDIEEEAAWICVADRSGTLVEYIGRLLKVSDLSCIVVQGLGEYLNPGGGGGGYAPHFGRYVPRQSKTKKWAPDLILDTLNFFI